MSLSYHSFNNLYTLDWFSRCDTSYALVLCYITIIANEPLTAKGIQFEIPSDQIVIIFIILLYFLFKLQNGIFPLFNSQCGPAQ